PPPPIASLWAKHSHSIANKAIRIYSRSEPVETSRLHGHILTSLLQKENTVIDNNYGKNASYYHTWREDEPNTRHIQN
ncbi:pyruvyl transferase, partial [Bacillus vallismortis]|nr:pyruvyl transferase [Bacillus vallismortis]